MCFTWLSKISLSLLCWPDNMKTEITSEYWASLCRRQDLKWNFSKGKSLKKHYTAPATAAAKSLQSCPTLCDPIDSRPPGSPVPGILQARTLEWVAISFSNAWKWKVKVKSLSRARLLATPWTAAYQAPPSMGFSRQEYWSGVPLPSPTLPLEARKLEKRVWLEHWSTVTWVIRF